MPLFTLVNPNIPGKQLSIDKETKGEAGQWLYESLMNVSKSRIIKDWCFSFKDEKHNLYNFKVTESGRDGDKIEYRIKPFELKDKKRGDALIKVTEKIKNDDDELIGDIHLDGGVQIRDPLLIHKKDWHHFVDDELLYVYDQIKGVSTSDYAIYYDIYDTKLVNLPLISLEYNINPISWLYIRL